MPVKPITPKEAASGQQIPDIVIDTVNRHLQSCGGSRRIVLSQNILLQRLEEQGLLRADIFDKGWLNFEPLFEEAGWDVTYDKPGYCEAGDAIFIFEPTQ